MTSHASLHSIVFPNGSLRLRLTPIDECSRFLLVSLFYIHFFLVLEIYGRKKWAEIWIKFACLMHAFILQILSSVTQCLPHFNHWPLQISSFVTIWNYLNYQLRECCLFSFKWSLLVTFQVIRWIRTKNGRFLRESAEISRRWGGGWYSFSESFPSLLLAMTKMIPSSAENCDDDIDLLIWVG